jgi:hypothetical protein
MTDNNIHETSRNTKTARATQNPCGEAVARWLWDSRNCSNDRGITQFCSPLEGCIQKRWAKCTGKQAATIETLQTIHKAAFKASKASLKRPQSKRLQNRLVDTAKNRTANTKAFWPIVSAFRGLVCSLSYGLQLPKTREEGARTRRAGHRTVAKEGLASYKKKPVEPAEPSYWSMNAVLCFSQLFAALGRQKDKHQFNIAGTEETGSRPFLRSVFRRCATDLVCTSPFRTAISGWVILKHLYRCCWSIFQRVLSWFSTARWFTAGQKEDCVRGFPGVLTLNGSRPTPLNLIRSNRSGITASTVSLLTIFLMMYSHLRKQYVILSSIFVHKNFCYALSSKKPDLKYDSFH